MNEENVVIIEEGTAVGNQTEQFLCCWAVFLFTF